MIRDTIVLILLTSTFISCNSNNNHPVSSINKDTFPIFSKSDTNLNEQNNHLIVFVGEKIEINEIKQEKPSFDNGFKAKYKVIQRIYGFYTKDTIEFEAYDHYGLPPFATYKHVLLFVVEEKGRFYQEKYQYFDVYKTSNGKWAGSYSSEEYSYNNHYYKNTDVKAERISFLEEVSYSLDSRSDEDIQFLFPKPYYKIVGNKAIPVFGNYVEDLFRLKKIGILKMRGLF